MFAFSLKQKKQKDMKTRLLALTFIATIGFLFAFAGEPEMAVKQLLNEKIQYPEFARKALIEGKVFVTFTIDEQGKIMVKESNSLNEDLRKYVVEELNETVVTPSKDFIGKTFSMKFSFELIK
jgi:hypothetical protein